MNTNTKKHLSTSSKNFLIIASVLIVIIIFLCIMFIKPVVNKTDYIETTTSETTTSETTTTKTTEATTTTEKNDETVEDTTVEETVLELKKVTEVETEIITSKGHSLGMFKITVYTPGSDGGRWGYATATGVRSKHLKTCAVDPNVIKLGSTIEVNGLILTAVDTGSAVKGNHIDIFYDGSEKEAINWASNFGTYHEVKLY